MKFTHQYEPNDTKIEISLHRDSTLPSVLEAFEDFLRASGYVFEGHLKIIEETVYEKEEKRI